MQSDKTGSFVSTPCGSVKAGSRLSWRPRKGTSFKVGRPVWGTVLGIESDETLKVQQDGTGRHKHKPVLIGTRSVVAVNSGYRDEPETVVASAKGFRCKFCKATTDVIGYKLTKPVCNRIECIKASIR